MYPIVVLSLIAVALLVLGGKRREGLEATNLIKAPNANNTYDNAERDRIWNMIPAADKSVFVEYVTSSGAGSEDTAKTTASTAVALFYVNRYQTATAPITIDTVNAWITSLLGANAPQQSKDFRRAVLKAYFIDQAMQGGPPATGATGTSTPGAPANPQGASSTGGTPAPAPGLYIQLKTEFDTKKAAYDALVASASQSTNPTEDVINQLRTMNRELVTLLEQTIQALSTIQSEELGTLNGELATTLNTLEQQYGILSENSDRVETLRRIREFEETKKGGSVGIYMIALLLLALATLVIMVFFQRTNAPATAATVSPPSMANFT